MERRRANGAGPCEAIIRALLIANRGEISIRIARAASELGLHTVSVHSEDDGESMHRFTAAAAVPLRGAGPAAYLDQGN